MKLDPDLERKILELGRETARVRLGWHPEPVDEDDFTTQVRLLAEALGWIVYHTHDSRKSAPGFPDLVLVRERIVFAELKMPGKQATAEQAAWLHTLMRAGAEVYLWVPEQWEEIGQVLARDGRDTCP
jgi:hypothetical protein